MPQHWMGRTHRLVSGNVVVTGFMFLHPCSPWIAQRTLLLEDKHSTGGRDSWTGREFLLFQSGEEAGQQLGL